MFIFSILSLFVCCSSTKVIESYAEPTIYVVVNAEILVANFLGRCLFLKSLCLGRSSVLVGTTE